MMKISNRLIGIILLLLAASIIGPGVGWAVISGQIDTFEDGTTGGWMVGLRGGVPQFPPVSVTGGPAGEGDHFMLLRATGSLVPADPGSRLTVINLTRWAGNYSAAGVNTISMNVNNLGSTDLYLRLLIADGDPGFASLSPNTAISTNPVFVPAGSGWIFVVFPVGPEALTALRGNASAALANAIQLRILHNPVASFPPPQVEAQLGVDNIAASAPAPATPGDFDGDGKTDIAVYRGNNGVWFIMPSQGGAPYGVSWGGDPTDIPARGDYDGDRKADIAVYRSSNGAWFIMPSQGGAPYGVGWGGDAADKPVQGDYDGDGRTDVAVYRASGGSWFVVPSSGIATFAVGWGGDPTDQPVPGDYDGDGKIDVAVYRQGIWFVVPSSGAAPFAIAWGESTDIPVPGDYDGDTKTDMAVYRGSSGVWFVTPSSGAAPFAVGWGGDATDISVPGDYDGDGRTDLAVYRGSSGVWFVTPSSGAAPFAVGWGGGATDIPVTAIP